MAYLPIECVANVSEGRRRETLDAIAHAIRSAPGVVLLDWSADWAHHRSVFTMAGTAAGLESAVLALTHTVVATIDLRRHRGEHPRIGALDVVPFVPLGDTPMGVCAALARRVARELSARFSVPVYLYADAALVDARRRLEDVRRGQFEGLAAKMTAPDGGPDFGQPHPHPSAGATAVGARPPLIAFNVNLATDRLELARAVAAVVRERGGGLAAVKALGIRLDDGRVQVSMNLTDFHQTGMGEAFARVRDEARARGVDVAESELIGLAPAAALDEATAREIRLRDFSLSRILEVRLREVADSWNQ
jgi:glutamate formiminotransferase / 5-formyltetrahydrofolate cyclo-ligase